MRLMAPRDRCRIVRQCRMQILDAGERLFPQRVGNFVEPAAGGRQRLLLRVEQLGRWQQPRVRKRLGIPADTGVAVAEADEDVRTEWAA